MSAKNRGTEVQPADCYMTPTNLAKACVDSAIATFPASQRKRLRILEPSAGVGAFVTPLSKHGRVTANEIDNRFSLKLRSAGASGVRIGRTETLRPDMLAGKPYDLIMGNPPYSSAAEHIDHLRQFLKPRGRLFMLLRVNFLGAQCRREFWGRNPLSALHVIRPRPFFLDAKGNRIVGKNGKPASDATEYALFQWDRSRLERYGTMPFQFVEWTR